MKICFTILAVIFLHPQIIFCQSPYTNILVDNQNNSEEPSICVNPKNLNQVVAGANIFSVFTSGDGGATWTAGSLINSSWGVWGDPIITVDTAGSFYYFHLAQDTGFGFPYYCDRIICQKSTDAGATWNNPGSFMGLNNPKIQDKQGVAIDWTHGPRGNWIYVTWTEFDDYGTNNPADSSRIMFSRSTDAGASWAPAHRINKRGGDCIDADYTTEGAVPCVGPNGELYDAWAGPLGVNNFAIFFDRSTDGGTTWLADNIIAGSQPGGWDYFINGIYRSNGLPCTLCDVSPGPHRGTIYINYTDSAGPDDHDVKIIKSTNGGFNWSAPIRVNDDPAGKEQFLSWMAIDQATGYLYCVFYDRRNYTTATTDVFMAHSTDGGDTWINERISATPFMPNNYVFFGDYNGISAANGRIRPMWTRMDGFGLSVYTALIDEPIAVTPISSGVPASFKLYQNYPNPFNPTTKIRFDVPANAVNRSSNVKLVVYNELGKEIGVLFSGNLDPGTHEIEWDASNCSSGIYFCKLSSADFSETRKMILIK